MSYARFSEDSDVYVFLDVYGYFSCCACRLSRDGMSEKLDTTDALLAHLDEHEAAGHAVPDRTRHRLMAERAENDAWIAGRQ